MTHSLLAQLLGRYISESRLKQNIKQSHLAEHLGFSRQFMNQIENGEALIPKAALINCVNILELSSEKLKFIYRLCADQEVAELLQDSRLQNEKKSYG